MIKAKDATVWVNFDAGEVMVTGRELEHRRPHEKGWCDPIGAAYGQWQQMTNPQRVNLMLETAIDLAMKGVPMQRVLVAFAEVREFRALGGRSYPMCRALTTALVGRTLEFNTMTFEELLVHYAPERVIRREQTKRKRHE